MKFLNLKLLFALLEDPSLEQNMELEFESLRSSEDASGKLLSMSVAWSCAKENIIFAKNID